MARGKYAARADNRQHSIEQGQIRSLSAELAAERERHHGQAEALKGEIRDLNSQILAKAKVIADKAIEARRAELEKALADNGMSWDVIQAHRDQKDRLIYNACRYLSITEGTHPLNALQLVWTWFTDVDCYALPYGGSGVDWIALGLPKDGWVARTLQLIDPRKRKRVARKAYERGKPYSRSIDNYLADHPDDVHPDYRKYRYYYDNVQYGKGLILEDDEGGEVAY